MKKIILMTMATLLLPTLGFSIEAGDPKIERIQRPIKQGQFKVPSPSVPPSKEAPIKGPKISPERFPQVQKKPLIQPEISLPKPQIFERKDLTGIIRASDQETCFYGNDPNSKIKTAVCHCHKAYQKISDAQRAFQAGGATPDFSFAYVNGPGMCSYNCYGIEAIDQDPEAPMNKSFGFYTDTTVNTQNPQAWLTSLGYCAAYPDKPPLSELWKDPAWPQNCYQVYDRVYEAMKKAVDAAKAKGWNALNIMDPNQPINQPNSPYSGSMGEKPIPCVPYMLFMRDVDDWTSPGGVMNLRLWAGYENAKRMQSGPNYLFTCISANAPQGHRPSSNISTHRYLDDFVNGCTPPP